MWPRSASRHPVALDLVLPDVFSARPVTNSVQLRAEYDATLSAVSTRRSTLHFAHGAISLLVGLIGAATAGKLWWDFGAEYELPSAALAFIALGVLVYSLVRYLLGRRALSTELVDFTKLKRLRQELGLDDPRALLP